MNIYCTNTNRILAVFFGAMLSLTMMACQKAASVSKAVKPNSSDTPAPMGSKTSNKLMQKELDALNRLLDGKYSLAEISEAKANKSKQNGITSLFSKLSLNHLNFPLTDLTVKKFLVGELYFTNQRFIEAATNLSQVLDISSTFPRARNMLARSFYFLGNPDRALNELDFILLHQGNYTSESIDALYLSGVIIEDSKIIVQTKLKKGIFALETYLKIAKNSVDTINAQESLAKLKGRLKAMQPNLQ